MAGLPCIMVEIATSGSTIYVGTHNYVTRAADTPASTFFEARLMQDLSFSRSIGLAFFNTAPRGQQNFGTIDVVNADGNFDSLVGSSLRDKAVTVKRGETGDAYSTFTTVATLVVDRVEFDGEKIVRFYVKDISAKLDRPLQQNTYPTTHPVAALRGRPRPLTVGRCYQVPALQTNATGNGQFDVHEDDDWIGLEQVLDQGATLIEGTAYERSTVTGVYGFERLTAIAGKQVATVLGEYTITTTHIDEGFTALTNWTETNGGAGGRDASISSNQLSMVNTAGGADLHLDFNTSISATRDKYFVYQVDCTSWTSGYCQIRPSSIAATIEKTIDAAGHYSGVIRAASSFTFRITAPNGSNCSLLLDNLKLYEVTPVEQLSDVVTYLTVTKGPLVSGDLNSSAISTLQTDTGYRYGFHAPEPVSIASMLDQVCTSIGGAWWINRSGKLTLGRLTAPTGTAVLTFDQSSIKDGMQVQFDQAEGLSNRILAKRNWAPYAESEIVASLNYVQLNASDKDADVTLSNGNYNYSAANVGSVRDTPALFGDRIYFEVLASTVDGTGQHYIGWGNSSATITSYPGATADSLSYRANGQTYSNAAGSAYGNTWTSNDRIGVAVDMRPAAMGSRQQHYRLYWSKNGTWQNSSNPDTEAAPVLMPINAVSMAYAMIGGNVAGTNAGTVNFGQAAFTYTPPADYMAPAWHRQFVLADFRLIYQTSTSMAAAYAASVATAGAGDAPQGIPTLLSRDADAKTECDRWAALYASERFLYTFTALLDAGVNADQLEPFDVIEVTYPRFGLSAKKLRVIGVEGQMLGRAVQIKAWG